MNEAIGLKDEKYDLDFGFDILKDTQAITQAEAAAGVMKLKVDDSSSFEGDVVSGPGITPGTLISRSSNGKFIYLDRGTTAAIPISTVLILVGGEQPEAGYRYDDDNGDGMVLNKSKLFNYTAAITSRDADNVDGGKNLYHAFNLDLKFRGARLVIDGLLNVKQKLLRLSSGLMSFVVGGNETKL